MLSGNKRGDVLALLIDGVDNCYKVKRILNNEKKLSMIQILNERGRISKCLFYDENGRSSNLCIYNPSTGKEVKNITYRADGKTISSIREYYSMSGVVKCVTFYKEDGKNISSSVEYDEKGDEVCFFLYDEKGNVSKNFF